MIRLWTGLPTTTGLPIRGHRLHRLSAARCLSRAVSVTKKRDGGLWGSPSLANSRWALGSVTTLAAVAATAATAATAAEAAAATAAAEATTAAAAAEAAA